MRIQQIMINLLSNAIKFSKEATEIQVKLEIEGVIRNEVVVKIQVID